MEVPNTRAWVEVDLGALQRNAQALAHRSGKPLLPMVKADAYGLGAVAVARALAPGKPWGFGVASVDEAAELRAAGIDGRLLVFSPLLSADFARLRQLAATPTLGSAESISRWVESGGGAWHLAIDTGMSRAGVPWRAIETVCALARSAPPEGAFTHFHSAELNDGSRAVQEERFRTAIAQLPARPTLLHAENSPAIERADRSVWDLARPGVFLYGVGGGDGAGIRPEPVATLRARVVEMRDVAAGDSVSYGATYQAPAPRRIATVSAGYADGYRRSLGNRGVALVSGRRVAIAGMVTMDMTMLDVTDVACEVGDVATLMGRDGDEAVDVNELARRAELSPYELLVGLKLRAPRVYVGTSSAGSW